MAWHVLICHAGGIVQSMRPDATAQLVKTVGAEAIGQLVAAMGPDLAAAVVHGMGVDLTAELVKALGNQTAAGIVRSAGPDVTGALVRAMGADFVARLVTKLGVVENVELVAHLGPTLLAGLVAAMGPAFIGLLSLSMSTEIFTVFFGAVSHAGAAAVGAGEAAAAAATEAIDGSSSGIGNNDVLNLGQSSGVTAGLRPSPVGEPGLDQVIAASDFLGTGGNIRAFNKSLLKGSSVTTSSSSDQVVSDRVQFAGIPDSMSECRLPATGIAGGYVKVDSSAGPGPGVLNDQIDAAGTTQQQLINCSTAASGEGGRGVVVTKGAADVDTGDIGELGRVGNRAAPTPRGLLPASALPSAYVPPTEVKIIPAVPLTDRSGINPVSE
jgi:hypothetical protein